MFNLIEKAMARVDTVPEISPLGGTLDVKDTILTIINWVIYAAGAIAIVYLIYGGILYITAGGDAEKASKGKTALINAIIGIIVVFLSLAIFRYFAGGEFFGGTP